jgi:1-acyl-sn-glycerol-3-phosphate acyltransferase
MVFPEGSRMRDGQLHPARPGLGLLAVSADVPIVPCFVRGSNHPRRWLFRMEKLRICFGKPQPWQVYAGKGDMEPGRALYRRIGEGVMNAIAEVRDHQLHTAPPGAG